MTLWDMITADEPLGPYDDSEKLWLHGFRHNPLLQAQPLLLLLAQYYAEHQRWPVAKRRKVCLLTSAEALLQAVALPVSDKAAWLCQHVTELSETCEVVHYALSELKALYLCFQHGVWECVEVTAINPRVAYVMGLAKLLSRHPELATARFIRRSRQQRLCFDLAECKVMLIKQTAARLGIAANDMQKKLLRCRHQSDLNGLFNRLDRHVSERVLQALQTVDLDDLASVYEACQPYLSEQQRLDLEAHWYERYSVLPWANHPDIVQLTDYPMLFLEAHEQHHCGLTYRHHVASGDYALFKVLHPERATLGLQWQPKQQRFVIDELVAQNNQAVNNATRRFVKRWLKQAQS